KKFDEALGSYLKIEALCQSASDLNLISYPKRLYYMQYKMTRKKFPKLAKRAAKHFDKIDAPSFLSKKVYYWKFINWFGLYYGTLFYKMLQPFWKPIHRKTK